MRSPGFIVFLLLLAVVALFVVGKSVRDHREPDRSPLTAPALTDASPSTASVAQSVRVVDGDTIHLNDERIRLFGIDAPEKSQSCNINGQNAGCGFQAEQHLKELIGTDQLTCVARSKDRFGRTVAVCSVNGKDLGREMVASGWAVAFERYSRDYVADEAAARAARRGMWQGTFDRPETWRAERRQGR